jgi:hypothetical protein
MNMDIFLLAFCISFLYYDRNGDLSGRFADYLIENYPQIDKILDRIEEWFENRKK